MIQFTDSPITLRIGGVELTDADDVWVTIKQRAGDAYQGDGVQVTDVDLEVVGSRTFLTFELTQEQTASLNLGNAEMQVNWIDAETGKRKAGPILACKVTRNLCDEVRH